MSKSTETKDLVAGILYCLFVVEDSCECGCGCPADLGCRHRDGALVYWTGVEFMDEEGDVRFDDWDYAVAQSGTPNKEWIAS